MSETVFKRQNNIERVYSAENGVRVRDIEIDCGIDTPVRIGFVTDLHFNYCNEKDIAEADPVLMSTIEHRKWLANAASVPNARHSLKILESTDQIVIGGDVLDYLSEGTMEIMDREVWGKYPNVLVAVGGHELARKMQGTVEETTTYKERLEMIKKYWKHDIYYVSRLLKGRVMVAVMLNDKASFNGHQKERLQEDINRARKNGYPILLFFHEPIRTRNPSERDFTCDRAITVGDPSPFPMNYCDGTYLGYPCLAGNEMSDRTTKEVFALITENADVVRGVFAGHQHNDCYTEIIGKLPDGSETVIPQFIFIGTPYEKGNSALITVK